MPAVASWKRLSRPASGSGSGSRAGSWTRATSAADHSRPAAANTNTEVGPLMPSMMPPMPGPRKIATPSTVVATALAAVSCSGVRASSGSSAACAGRKMLVVIAAIDASRHSPARPMPSETANAITMISPPRSQLDANITRFRG